MKGSLTWDIIYVLVITVVCLRILYDTRSTTKSLAYILLVIFLPIAGIIFYFSFGMNYRKRKMYTKKLEEDGTMALHLREKELLHSIQVIRGNKLLESTRELAYMLCKTNKSPLTDGNSVTLLVNGENKFPGVLEVLEKAEHHIHIEYYIYDDDVIGRTIEKILISKAKQGVDVRFIYDDFGSWPIRKAMAARLRDGGVKIFPFHEIRYIALANSLNYRNHRKIIIVDGEYGFVGGINVSDRYINSSNGKNKLFWRDTHLMIRGPGVHYLQYIFLCDWNFCAKDHLKGDIKFFPPWHTTASRDDQIVQIASSGPDSETPVILFSLLQAINLASEEILITTPYFIPGESIMDALVVAALGGVKVKVLLPAVSDSALVNLAARSYYEDLLEAGAEIYLYKKGFVHAKTLVTDRKIAIVGTANMDYRSFDLNFEVNAIVYDTGIAGELRDIFFDDLKHAEMLDAKAWLKRPWYKIMPEKCARLISPLL